MYVFIKALATLSHVCKKYAHATRHQKGWSLMKRSNMAKACSGRNWGTCGLTIEKELLDTLVIRDGCLNLRTMCPDPFTVTNLNPFTSYSVTYPATCYRRTQWYTSNFTVTILMLVTHNSGIVLFLKGHLWNKDTWLTMARTLDWVPIYHYPPEIKTPH